MSIQAWMFDLGGVLIRVERLADSEKWARRLNCAEEVVTAVVIRSLKDAMTALGSVAEPELWQHVGTSFGLNVDEAAELRQAYSSQRRLNVELAEFVRSLSPRFRTAIVSNAWAEAREAFGWLQLDDIVERVMYSYELGVRKPNPAIYERAAEELGLQPEECCFIDDEPSFVDGARQVGMRAIQYMDNAQVITEIRKLADGQ